MITKAEAANIFGVKDKQVGVFSRPDPFNNDSIVEGFICRKRSKNGGSLVITKVDGKSTKQIIWATPKLAYPYREVGTRDWINFGKISTAVLSEKFNGMNVLFYKYKDANGNERWSAKSKGTPFINDSDAGPFLTLLKEAMRSWEAGNYRADYDEFLSWKNGAHSDAHAISFELCGQKEPHLVNYGFDLALKPLFLVCENGRIRPIVTMDSVLVDTDAQDLVELCQQLQNDDLKRNEYYRERENLDHKYEYNHFITEGKVLYVLGEDGYVKNRTMYKVKPTDIEEVHWQQFDEIMEGRVDEAIQKLFEREYDLTELDLREELDMGPKEWGKFGRSIKKYIDEKGVPFKWE